MLKSEDEFDITGVSYIYCVIRVRCKYVNKLVNINNSYQSVPVTGRTPVTYYGGSGGIT